MRNLIIRTAMIACAALALAGCGRGNKAANNVSTNELDANMTLTAPANDASAVESATNLAEPAAPPANNTGTDAPPPSVNNVEANTVGM
ncbi:MAG: hypothetical protein QOG13_388 [Sphingomonadales bacterium]|jgi:hypothetical protein|nr:hypothetical protein [Sphingomonadales bacterium]MEA3044980.1 hypothetical protein [Sphingomonadales bacterium]